MLPMGMMEEVVDYQPTAGGNMQQSVIQAEIQTGLAKISRIGTDLIQQINQNYREGFKALKGGLEQIAADDPNTAIKPQIELLKRTVQKCKENYAKNFKTVEIAKSHLNALNAHQWELCAGLGQLRLAHERACKESPFLSFLGQAGGRACEHVSNPQLSKMRSQHAGK
jgi:hypothetical protein